MHEQTPLTRPAPAAAHPLPREGVDSDYQVSREDMPSKSTHRAQPKMWVKLSRLSEMRDY